MDSVAHARRRERQVLKLRSIAIAQVHRAALVRYLRDGRIVGADREQTLRQFYGISDVRDAALAEHRNYLLAASTQLCAGQILELVGDQQGIDLVHSYELAYTQYFAMFCDRSRALHSGKSYLLASLLPEVKNVADRLRLRILDSNLPVLRPAAISQRPRAATNAPTRPFAPAVPSQRRR
jgi:hypothetical protein